MTYDLLNDKQKSDCKTVFENCSSRVAGCAVSIYLFSVHYVIEQISVVCIRSCFEASGFRARSCHSNFYRLLLPAISMHFALSKTIAKNQKTYERLISKVDKLEFDF